jgi:hypothetical protein
MPGLCGMFIFMRFLDPKRSHFVNIWPHLDQNNELCFEMRSFPSNVPLSIFFATSNCIPEKLYCEEEYGFYAIHFIVDNSQPYSV